MFNKDVAGNFFIGFSFILAGAVMVWIPNRVFSFILNAAFLLFLFNGLDLFRKFLKDKRKMDLLISILAFSFSVFLTTHVYLPQWIIRVVFGIYCLISALASFIQLMINYMNDIQGKLFYTFLILVYTTFGVFLLLSPDFDSDYLMQFFGLYFIVLGFRYQNDAIVGVNPLVKYEWKRKIRISLPPIFCAFIPDWALSGINKYLSSGKPYQIEKKSDDEDVLLKVMVHVGPYGFQKVGHISFAYKNIVYSYGNYDSDSFHWNQTIGDGVYFNVPLEYYIPNAMSAEKNSIFEYGIRITKEQEVLIEQQLQNIRNNSYRWYSRIEREDGYDCFENYKMDYPSRLHYKTGAKFYKFKSGRFKVYWALGDNCALFTDTILGKLGCDVLNMRGIISPGTYLEYLQNEYLKKNSPIVSLKLHSIEENKQKESD